MIRAENSVKLMKDETHQEIESSSYFSNSAPLNLEHQQLL